MLVYYVPAKGDIKNERYDNDATTNSGTTK